MTSKTHYCNNITMMLNVTSSVSNKCSPVYYDSVATPFYDTVPSPHTLTSTKPSKHKTDDPLQPFLNMHISPQKIWQPIYYSAHLYSLYHWIEYSVSLYYFYTKLLDLILRKMIKIITTSTTYQILTPKCTKFNFGWRSALDSTAVAYSTPSHTVAGFRGLLLTLKGRDTRQGIDHNAGSRWDGKTPPSFCLNDGTTRPMEHIINLPNKALEPPVTYLSMSRHSCTLNISQITTDTATVTTQTKQRSTSKLSNATTFNDIQWPLTPISTSPYYSTSKNSKNVQHRPIFTMALQQKVAYRLSNCAICNNFQGPLTSFQHHNIH